MCVYLKIVEPKTMSQLLHLKSLNILKAISLCLFVSCNLTNKIFLLLHCGAKLFICEL